MQFFLFLFFQIVTLFQLYFLSINKKVSWKATCTFLCIGYFSVCVLTFIVHFVTTRFIPPSINSYTLNPIVEELLTIAPLVILLRFTSLKNKLGILDCMILASALGLGFGLFETGIRILGSYQNWNLALLSWKNFFPALVTWLPERLHHHFGYAGHGILAALMGLGIGFWIRFKKWGWIVFLVTVVWAIFDHALSNYTLGSYLFDKKVSQFIWHLTGQGSFSKWMIALVLIGIQIYDFIINKNEFLKNSDEHQTAFKKIFKKYFQINFWEQLYLNVNVTVREYPQIWKNWSWKQKTIFIFKVNFWISVFLFFFGNGILPKSFYHWYFKSLVGHLAAITGYIMLGSRVWHWVQRFIKKDIPEHTNAQLLFWGQGILLTTAALLIVVSPFLLYLDNSSINPEKFLQIHFLFYAIKSGLNFAEALFISAILAAAPVLIYSEGNNDSSQEPKKKADKESQNVDKNKPNYSPKRNLPRDSSGRPVPQSEHPHTQLGQRKGYNQAREFGKDGKIIKDIDFTDHGHPNYHPNPHQHRYDTQTGERLGPEKLK